MARTGSSPAPEQPSGESLAAEGERPILRIETLSIELDGGAGLLRLLDGVSLTVMPGEVVAVVGETGSGKSLTGMSALGVFPNRARVTGRIEVDGLPLLPQTSQVLRAVRGRRVAVVPQNPSTALNPVFTIGQQVGELLRTHQRITSPRAQREETLRLLKEVELPRPQSLLSAYPHQLSGGMQQRALLAMALACRPALIVADEPTTALDVTTQAQILSTLLRIRRERSLAMLWITHDLGVAARIADRVVVLYAGQVMEEGSVGEVLGESAHPYTRAVLRSLPQHGKRVRDIELLPGDLPSPAALPPGCRFHPRCPARFAPCDTEVPAVHERTPGHRVRCHLYAPSLRAVDPPEANPA